MAADRGNLRGDDDERSVGRQPEQLGGFPGVGRREVAFEEGLEEGGALLLGGEGLRSCFFSVAADFAGEFAGVVSSTVNMSCQVGAAVTASLTPLIAAHFGWKQCMRLLSGRPYS